MRSVFWTLLLFLAVWDLYSLLPPRPPFPDPGTVSAPPFKQGIIHVHSIYSDGGGTIAHIAHAAKRAGMDFVVITDHNTSRARAEGMEKNIDGVDMYVEMEASTPAGHALIFYSQTDARNLSDDVVNNLAYQHFMGKDTRPGVFVVTAHPSNLKTPWTVLDRSPDGTEVINFDSIWRELADSSKLDFALTLLIYPFNNFLSALRFLQINPKDFLAWDTMNSVSKGHFGIVAHDTHAKLKLYQDLALSWPGYFQTFQLAANIIFAKDPFATEFEERKKQLYRSLREGHVAITFPFVYPFRGNDWRLHCGDNDLRAGDETSFTRNCEFTAQVPRGFPHRVTYRLVRNGEPYREVAGTDAEPVHFQLEQPGVYRLEVWAQMHTQFHLLLSRPVPYVFYNPIYVR